MSPITRTEKRRWAAAGGGISGLRLFLLGTIFCVSGISALVYQVAWQRILAFHSGVGIYSIAVIVAAFMAGLGGGSYAGGVVSARIRRATALKIFAALELGVGLFALLSCAIYYDLLYVNAKWLYASLWTATFCHFAALAIPTTLMGMSLPILVRATVDDPRFACRRIGFLYGINILGAGLGALLAPWILIRFLGIQGAVWVGAGGNVLAGLTALALGIGRSRGGREAAEVAPLEADAGTEATSEREPSRPFGLWIALYTLSGFCALALEIIWFRIMDVAVKSTAFTFGTVLAIFLFGLAAGALWGGRRAVAVKRPLEAFLRYQSMILIYSGAAICLLAFAPTDWPIYRLYFIYWRDFNEFRFGLDPDPKGIICLYLVLPVLLYAPPTVLMGMSFGVLQRAVQDDRRTSGRKVGILQAGNIAGNVAGSLVVGLVLLNWFGASGSVRSILVLGLAFPVLGLIICRRGWRFGALAAVMTGIAVCLPSGHELWLRLHGLEKGVTAFFDEDATGVVGITPAVEGETGTMRMTINGKGHSWIPYGAHHSQLGAAAAIVHDAPRDIAVIGLGSGDTAWAAGCRGETERIVVYEICSPEIRLLNRLLVESQEKSIARFLGDPRFEHLLQDGRNALSRSGGRFDIIESDALRPTSAYAGNLYSTEFFQLCAGRLKPGGIMCQWAPTDRVKRSFREVFPHVVVLGNGPVILGSNEPLTIDLETWRARLNEETVLSRLGAPIAELVWETLRAAVPMSPDAGAGYRPNRDLFPRDEFVTPAAW